MRARTLSRPTQPSHLVFPFSALYKLSRLMMLSYLLAVVSSAQTQTPAQTPYLFTKTPITQTQDGVITLLRDPHSGILTPLTAPTSTFPNRCIPEAMEPQGQFLIGVCSGGLAMYSFDGTTGAVQEIAASPFSVFPASNYFPFLVAAESSGQFVYLLKFSPPAPVTNEVTYQLDKFQIDRTTPQLVPIHSQNLPFSTPLVGAAADPNGHGIAVVAMETDQQSSATTPLFFVITFDPATGAETIPPSGNPVPGTTPTAFALSPQGKYFALGSTTTGFHVPPASYTTLFTMSTNTFSVTGAPLTINSPSVGPPTTQPIYFNFDPLGGVLYIQYENSPQPPLGASPFEIYQVPELTHLGTLPFEQGDIAFGGIADPDAVYRYEIAPGTAPQGLAVWVIDPGTGLPFQPPSLTAPFFPSLNLNPIFANYASSGGGQNLSGPFLSQSASSLTFSSTTTGTSSASQTITLNSTGGQPAGITSIVASGANASDFVLSGNCLTTALLQPQTSCQLSVTFAPTKVGSSVAIVSITGNSPSSPQAILLSGTAVAPPTPAPVTAFSTSNPFTLPGVTTQGTSASPQTITVSNTGNAPLHISTVTLGGFNASDYALGTSTCSGAVVAANASCAISLTFSPLASGLRTATISIADDAANSPQVLSVLGDAVPAASINTGTGGSTSISLAAGQTAQFNLTATPGAGFNGVISFTCTGVPFGATCSVPSVSVANGAPAPFTVTVTTASAAGLVLPPLTPPSLFRGPDLSVFLLALAMLLALFFVAGARTSRLRPVPLVVSAIFLALLVSSGLGCGGGTSTQIQTQLQPAATPAIAPNGGTFSSSYPTVSITDSTPGASIYYTTDGSIPSSTSSVYAAPFMLSGAGKVQAMATAPSHTASPVASASFKIQTAPGTYTITITPTAVATGSTRQLPMNPISLTLTVK